MATIKDRLKLFEANGPPIKPKPKIIPVKKLSNTDPGIITATENDESIKKPQNDLVNVAEAPLKTKNEVTLHVHEPNHDELHQNKSDFNNTTDIIHDKSEDKVDHSVKDRNENNEEDVIDNQETRKSDKSNDIIINKNETIICPNSDTDITIRELPLDDLPDNNYDDDAAADDDLSYEYYGSIYYLPGLENFHLIEGECHETALVQPIHHNTNNPQQTTNDLQTNSTAEMSGNNNEVDLNIEEVATNLKRNASKRLIEEIFNTSIWRNSINYSDNFIFTPSASSSHNGTEFDSSEKNSSNDFSSIISSSPSNDDHRKSSQSLSSKPIKKNIFTNMFRSKRGPKKSNEKTSQIDQTNDNYESDGHRESTSKRSTLSKPMEGDTDSVEVATKKPLNSIFNRDWLNSLGEGIKKKANVMSELRKVFSHSKGKHLKQVPQAK